jgi:hypothetical protein
VLSFLLFPVEQPEFDPVVLDGTGPGGGNPGQAAERVLALDLGAFKIPGRVFPALRRFGIARIEVVTPIQRRRRWTAAAKERQVATSL